MSQAPRGPTATETGRTSERTWARAGCARAVDLNGSFRHYPHALNFCTGAWKGLFKRLNDRGLRGDKRVTSDDHRGLVKALRRQFRGTARQRCQTRPTRNALGQTPRHFKTEMSAWLCRIFRSKS